MEITQKEQDFLNSVEQIISDKLNEIETRDKTLLDSLKENMSYIWENIYDMDKGEQAFAENQMALLEETQQANISELMSYRASKKSPYFAAVDFESNEQGFLSYHIGLRGIKQDTKVYVVDWRAPFSELYYNFDVGHGQYETENGLVTGEIKSKKQYKIENGKIIFAIESNIKIDDSILQEVLAKTSSEKMKNIVSTIQREQNAIIRKETQNNLIVQGVAGSGKTSIALHKIAYMLYKHRKTLNSNSILIISPNKFFSDYISAVLPELGEENIAEITMDEILQEELKLEIPIESKTEQVERLLSDEFAVKITATKNSFEFCQNIQQFCNSYFDNLFEAEDVYYDDFFVIDKRSLEEMFKNKYKNRPVYLKLGWIKDYVYDEVRKYDLKAPKSQINQKIDKMMGKYNIFDAYNQFLKQFYSLTLTINNKIYFEDAIALLYIKQYIYGYKSFNQIKHLVVDEFQDYNPLNYLIINKMFSCPKTILGDIGQSVAGAKTSIIDVFSKLDDRDCEVLTLNKSYRSTYEITDFANKISGRQNVEIVQRHGPKVQIAKYSNIEQKISYIIQSANYFLSCGHKTIGILTKTLKSCNKLNELLKDKLTYNHLTLDTKKFKEGIMLAPVFLVKGLEFDAVIIVDCDDNNYKTPIDREALYVASTRAMHQLRLIFAGNPTKFIL